VICVNKDLLICKLEDSDIVYREFFV
jgi:hypothetical protein